MNSALIDQYRDSDIAIIGLSGRFADAVNLHDFWNNLAYGKCSFGQIPESRIAELKQLLGPVSKDHFLECAYVDEISKFEPEVFNISTEECKYIDPQQRLLLELVEEAVENAGYSSKGLSGQQVGVYVAFSKNTYGTFIDRSMPLALANTIEASIAGRVAYTFNFCGPTLAIDTACSASMTALHYAVLGLRAGECEYALVGGVNLYVLPPEKSFLEISLVSSKRQRVRAFDKSADGTAGGEGGGVLFLKPLKKALADGDVIQAIIKGSAVNSNGRRSTGLTAPSQYAQSEVIIKALNDAGVEPLSISYIETHGTGTKLGDPIEVDGIRLAYEKLTERKQFIPIGSLKTNIGHLDSAAGVANVVKVVLALQHQQIPPSLHFEEPNPHINFINTPVYVNTQLSSWESSSVRRAGVTALGLTGTNCHIILEEAPEYRRGECSGEPNIFTISARTKKSLAQMIENLRVEVENHPGMALDDVAYTLNAGRNHWQYRTALLAKDQADFAEKLTLLRETTGMETEGSVVSTIFFYDDLEENLDNLPLKGLLTNACFQSQYNQCIPAGEENLPVRYFAYLYALTQLVKGSGLEPKGVLGVGLGKIVADTVIGKITLEAGIEQARQYQPKYQTVQKDKLNAVLQKMMSDGHNTFAAFSAGRFFDRSIEELVSSTPGCNYLEFNYELTRLYEALAKIYVKGVELNWEHIYAGQGRRRVSLPTYAFNRASYLLEADQYVTRRQAAPAVEESDDEEQYPLEPVTFDDILAIIRKVVGEINPEVDFEEAGGDSLSVLHVVELIKKEYKVTIPMELFFMVETVQELIEEVVIFINNLIGESQAGDGATEPDSIAAGESAVQAEQADERASAAEGEERANSPVVGTRTRPVLAGMTEKPKQVLLTGVTGFLGAHLLHELLQNTQATVHCLVRGDNSAQALERCREKLSFYFGDQLEPLMNQRIIPVCGDITGPQLHMNQQEYLTLVEQVDTVVHSAADVRHYGKYEHFEKVNVQGTANLLAFAFSGQPKKFHHISTLGVIGTTPNVDVFRESDLDVGQELTGDVYGKSKFAAEKLVRQAMQDGLQASVYRVGNAVARYSDGVFQPNIDGNRMYNLLNALISLGKISDTTLDTARVELSPVDYLTNAIIRLMLSTDSIGHTFHTVHPKHLLMRDLCSMITANGFSLEEVSEKAFNRAILKQTITSTFSKERSILVNMVQTGRDRPRNPSRRVHFETEFTMEHLHKLGFDWPELNVEYIGKLLNHCVQVGYITKNKE